MRRSTALPEFSLTDPTPSLEAVLAELALVKRRLCDLELKNAAASPRSTRRWVGLGLLAGLVGSVALAANGNCPNGMPFCFAPDSPALASDINMNFAQLKEWLEQKVGTTGTSSVTVTGPMRVQVGGTNNAAASVGKPLFLSAAMSDGTSNTGGVEFRHDNLTQGVGIGYNTVYATGGSADQVLQLKAKGASNINLLSSTSVTGDLSCSANVWGSGPTVQSFVNRGPCAAVSSRCPAGQFVCGLQFTHACGVPWYEELYAVECCSL